MNILIELFLQLIIIFGGIYYLVILVAIFAGVYKRWRVVLVDLLPFGGLVRWFIEDGLEPLTEAVSVMWNKFKHMKW